MKPLIKRTYFIVHNDDKVFPDTMTKLSDLSKEIFITNYFPWENWESLHDEGYKCKKVSIEINPN